MADRVPTSGPWQTDPVLQQLIDQYIRSTSGPVGSRTGQAFRGSGNASAQNIGDQLSRYVRENRVRLGIPDNYFPDIQTRGQTLYDPNQNQFRNAAITGAAMGAGAYGLASLAAPGAAAPGAAAPAAAAPAAAAPAAAAPAAAGPLGSIAPAVAPAAASLGQRLIDHLTSPGGIAGLAGLITTLATRPGGGNGGGGSGDLISQNPQLSELLNMSAERARRTDPLHQSITQLAMQRLPTNVQR